MDIYITRHGETEWNVAYRMQGLNNSPLTDNGVNGAIALGKEINNIEDHITRCFVSPLKRAMDTTDLALSQVDYKIPVKIETLLREMDLGAFEGMNKKDASYVYPEAYDAFVNDPDNYVPVDGGESFNDVIGRAKEMLNKLKELKKEGESGPVLLVSHMIMVEALLFASGTTDAKNLRQTGPIKQTTLYKLSI